MGWDIGERGFRIVLSKEVPNMVYRHLAAISMHFSPIRFEARRYRRVGDAHRRSGDSDGHGNALDLPDGALDASWDCLRRVGNLSSSSVLFVLEEFLERESRRRERTACWPPWGQDFARSWFY